MTVDIRCPDCNFIATGRNEDEALLDFVQSPRHVCDPTIATDEVIGELQLRIMDLAQSAKMKNPTILNDCLYNCTKEHWIPFIKGGITFVKPCPVHRGGYVHPDDRPPPQDPNEAVRSQKQRESADWMNR